MLSNLRNFIYFSIDILKGSKVKNNLKILKKYDHSNYNDEWLIEDKEININHLLDIAVNETEYYAQFRGFKFEDFPLINKNIIKEYQKQFFNKNYTQDCLFQMSTSGSTGTPFTCYQNIEKKRKVNAETIYYSEKAGYKIGNNLIYLRSLSNRSKKPYYKQVMQNQFTLNCNDLSSERIGFLLNKIRKLNQNGKGMLLGYGSTYKVIKEYMENKKINPTIKLVGVVSGSDMLFDDVRESIEHIFKCRCYSRYSNEENGVIGQDDLENNVFVVNEANYHVEIFQLDKDKLANEGEIGRIVLTDLYNYAMPMIRYDTGDIGRIDYRVDRNGKLKKVINEFGGRKVDIIYNTSGSILSPHSITNMMWDYPNIKQFQFIQCFEKQYKLKLNLDGEIDINKIEKNLKAIIGSDAILEIEYADEIPVLQSGKRRYICNKWMKD